MVPGCFHPELNSCRKDHMTHQTENIIWLLIKSLQTPGLKHDQFAQMFNMCLKKKKVFFPIIGSRVLYTFTKWNVLITFHLLYLYSFLSAEPKNCWEMCENFPLRWWICQNVLYSLELGYEVHTNLEVLQHPSRINIFSLYSDTLNIFCPKIYWVWQYPFHTRNTLVSICLFFPLFTFNLFYIARFCFPFQPDLCLLT